MDAPLFFLRGEGTFLNSKFLFIFRLCMVSFLGGNSLCKIFYAVKCNLMELVTRSTSFTRTVSGLLDMHVGQDSLCSWSN